MIRWASKEDAEAWARDCLLYGNGVYRVDANGVRHYVNWAEINPPEQP